MKGVDKAIYDLLTDNERIRAMLRASSKDKANVYPYNPKTEISYPSVTYYESASEKYMNIPNCEELTYRLDIWTKNVQDSTRLGTAINDLLTASRVNNEYATVYRFSLFTSVDIYDSNTSTYHKSMTYTIIAIDREI